MVYEILTSQLSVEVATIVTFVLTVILATVMLQRYIAKRTRSLLFWGSAVWVFAIAVFLEILVAYGIQPEVLIAAYLLLVAILVELLALGSMELITSKKAKTLYKCFVILSTALLVYCLATSKLTNMVTDYIVYSSTIPLSVVTASSIITFPAAAILVIIAAKSYLKKRSNKLLSIIAGVIIVSIAGTLYIVQFPAFLYISEFIGILALWYGFI
jgi:hypothetical protein